MRLSRLVQSTTSLFSAVSKSNSMSTATIAPVTSLELSGKKGEFQRSDAKWRNWIKDTTNMNGASIKSTTIIIV
jgi:hypothetical protein